MLLWTVPALARATSVVPQPERASVAVDEKPPPVTVIGYEPTTKGTADGLISLISLPVTVKRAADVVVPPSGSVTVKVYVPGVADAPSTKFFGVIETVNDADGEAVVPVVPAVSVTPVNFVPSTVLVRDTTGAPTKEPARTTDSGVKAAVSAIVAGVAEVTVGAAFTVNAPARVPVPWLSVTVMGYEPGVVAEVDENEPVMVVPVVSEIPEKVTPGAVVVTVAIVSPSPAKAPVGPVMVKLPDAPLPKNAEAVVVPPSPPQPAVVQNVTEVTVSAAPAAVAIAIGSAAAASKAPAASAFTKWRCIRLGLFIVNSLHS